MKTATIVNRFGKTLIITHGPYKTTDEIRLVYAGDVYVWNPTGNGFPGCTQHGGNYLDGTEYRGASRGGGNWEREAIAHGTDDYVTYDIIYPVNDIPTEPQARAILNKLEVSNDNG